MSSFIVGDEDDVGGFTVHVVQNDSSRLVISGETLRDNESDDIVLDNVAIDVDSRAVDVSLRLVGGDDEDDGESSTPVFLEKNEDRDDGKYIYKAYGFVEFDRDVSGYDLDVCLC